MNILTPLNNKSNIKRFSKSGASEFYMGFCDKAWNDRFGEFSDINRMSGFSHFANPYSFNDLEEIIDKVKNVESDIFITLNANSYSKEQSDYITDKYLPKLKKWGTDGIIISDLSLISPIQKAGLDIVASTMCSLFNNDLVSFYSGLGINRMILPRELNLEEITEIANENPKVNFEVFIMRNGCTFSDGYCLGLHRPECGSTCSFIRRGNRYTYSNYTDFNEIQEINWNNYLFSNILHYETCGLCALYDFYKAGIKSLKIVGRADNPTLVNKDISIINENIKIAKKCSSREEYLKQMIFPENFQNQCFKGLSCYYPEIRF